MMDATKLRKTKRTISKGKIKKTIKNVLCRSDSAFWPALEDYEVIDVNNVLKNYSAVTHHVVKPNWNEIKLLEKNERPRPAPNRKIDGLYFGISECYNALQNKKISAVILDTLINPQSIAQPVIDDCVSLSIPVVCIKDLRNSCKNYFGIPTSCLGVKVGHMLDLSKKIKDLSQNLKPKPQTIVPQIRIEDEYPKFVKKDLEIYKIISNPTIHLYRTSKKDRVFGLSNLYLQKDKNNLIGQNFIKIPEKREEKCDSNAYMRMVLKKIGNNPNRLN